MTPIDFKQGIGFNIFVEPKKQEGLFVKIIPVLNQLDWNVEGAYFNFYEKSEKNESHAKLWIRANETIISNIRTIILIEYFLEEKSKMDTNCFNYYVPYSEERNNLNDFDNFEFSDLWLIKIKEVGTKYAIKIKEELDITPNTLTNVKLQEIAEKICKEKPEIIKHYIKFHFVANPLVHFEKGYETENQLSQRCINVLLKK